MSLRKVVQKTTGKRMAIGTVVSTANGGRRATVKLGGEGRKLTGIKVVGGSVVIGQQVTVIYDGGIPYIHSPEAPETSETVTIISSGGTPAGDGSADPTVYDLFTQAGWVINADGAITASSTYIYPNGKIVLGTSNNVIVLDTNTSGYRLWAGNADAASAPFSVSDAGAIKATSGLVGNWTISTDNLSADSGNAVISAATSPFIRLGTVAPPSFHGFWVGKDTAYKLYLGDHDGNNLIWNGTTLSITGTITATSGNIGGWLIETSQISTDSGATAINSATPSIKLGATGYNSGAGFWVGKDTSYKLFIGNSTGNKLLWDGTTLTIAGTVQSIDYVTGVSGWQINQNGDAEFSNINIRGVIKAAVFEFGSISATAGTSIITKTSGIAYQKFTSPATTSSDWTTSTQFRIKNFYPSTNPGIAANDIVRVQAYIGGTTKGFWLTVSSVSVQTDYTEIYATADWTGNTATEFPEGVTIIDYGPSGTGYIIMSTDGTYGYSPNISLATIMGQASSSRIATIGNLRNTSSYWGIGDTNTYGAAFGIYGTSGQASILINSTAGTITIFNNTTKKFQVDADGCLYLGTNITAAATTSILVSSKDSLSWNGDTLNTGDILIGDNNTNQANIFWDKDQGTLNFRGGKTVHLYIKASGELVSSASSLQIDKDGIKLLSSSSALSFYGEGILKGGLEYKYDQGTPYTEIVLSAGSQSGELLSNTGFESSLTGWTITGSVTRDTASKHTGSYGASFYTEALLYEYSQIISSSFITATAGKTYYYGGWAKAVNLQSNSGLWTITITLYFYNSSDTLIGSSSIVVYKTEDDDYWCNYNKSVVAPANTAKAKLRIHFDIEALDPAAGTLYIDDLTFSESAYSSQLLLHAEPSGASYAEFTEHIVLQKGITINEGGYDSDFRVESDTNSSMLIVDAGLNAVGIGGVAESGWELKVTGSAKITGLLQADGGVVFNEPGGNYDFRVESDTNTNMLMIDASLDAVGIGMAASSTYTLAIDGSVYSVNDMFPASDVAGSMRRFNAWTTPGLAGFEGFDSSSQPSYMYWAGSPFVNPTSYSFAGSFLSIGASTTAQKERMFLYKSSSNPGTSPGGFFGLNTNIECEIGLRIDDGDDSDYVEVTLKEVTDMNYVIIVRTRVNNGTPSEQTSSISLPLSHIVLRMSIGGTTWSAWYVNPIIALPGSMGITTRVGLTSTTLSFTPSRIGIIYTKNSTSSSNWMRGYCDWVYLP